MNFVPRSRGRPRKRYKDTLKVSLKRCNIEPDSWEVSAQDRASWRKLVKKGVSNYEQEFIAQKVDKRKRRKERLENPPTTGEVFLCPHCDCTFRARIAVTSHLRTHPHQLRSHELGTYLYNYLILPIFVSKGKLLCET